MAAIDSEPDLGGRQALGSCECPSTWANEQAYARTVRNMSARARAHYIHVRTYTYVRMHMLRTYVRRETLRVYVRTYVGVMLRWVRT